jgi:hypothetical protein
MEINFRPRPGFHSQSMPAKSSVAAASRILHEEDLSGGSFVWGWVGALFLFGFSSGMFWVFAVDARSLGGGLITGVFLVFGVASVAEMVRRTLDLRKFGRVTLALSAPFPIPGGTLTASIRLPPLAAAAGTLRADLECERITYRRGRGRNSTTIQREPVWTGRADIPVHGGRADITFALPAGAPASAPAPRMGRVAFDRPYCTWTLRVVADVPGVDLDRRFIVPVASAAGDAVATPAAAPTVTNAFVSAALAEASAGGAAGTDAPLPAAGAMAAAPRQSLRVLALGNLAPLAGVMFLGWRIGDVVLLYWVENLIVGAVNVLRMAVCVPRVRTGALAGSAPPRPIEIAAGKTFLIGFFVFHYGMFCMGHGVFLAHMFGDALGRGQGDDIVTVVGALLREPAFGIAVLGLTVSHLFSFFHNFIGSGEYRTADIQALMLRPYGRIVVVHLFIFAGAFATQAIGSPAAVMVAFIVIKVVVDAHFHLQERRKLRAG